MRIGAEDGEIWLLRNHLPISVEVDDFGLLVFGGQPIINRQSQIVNRHRKSSIVNRKSSIVNMTAG
jgi:hypothetical protein